MKKYHKQRHRLLSLLLCLMMTVSLLGTAIPAYAQEAEQPPIAGEETINEVTEDTTLSETSPEPEPSGELEEVPKLTPPAAEETETSEEPLAGKIGETLKTEGERPEADLSGELEAAQDKATPPAALAPAPAMVAAEAMNVARIGDIEYESLEEAFSAAEDGDTVVIINDLTTQGTIAVDKNITLTSDGIPHTLTIEKSLFDIKGILTVDAQEDENLIFDTTGFNSAGTEKGKAITISENGRVELICATFNAGSLNSNKSGAIVVKDHGTLNMSGGIIQNATPGAYYTCGVVLVLDHAVFEMNSGLIQKNNGVYTASFTQGAVRIYAEEENDTPSMIMTGGLIKENIGNFGGGIVVHGKGATFNMDGGEICDNEAETLGGGGVAVYNGGLMRMDGGVISGNKASAKRAYSGQFYGEGGGVLLYSDTAKPASRFEFNNGKITKNTARIAGGGINVGNNTSFVMNQGLVSENTAGTDGGGIYITAKTNNADTVAEFYGGLIENNHALETGGGVSNDGKYAITKFYHTLVTNNNASDLGGGIWNCPTGSMFVYIKNGLAVFDNQAAVGGHDIAFIKYADENKGNAYGSTLSDGMLGGGLNHYYKDGEPTDWVQSPQVMQDAYGRLEEGTVRYDATLPGDEEHIFNDQNHKLLLINCPSDESKQAAQDSAGVIIRNNTAAYGGGINNNGNLYFGDAIPHGSLKVNTTVSGPGGDKNQAFTFTVTLYDSDFNGRYGDMNFTDGVATFTLKHGESKTAIGLPVGAAYTVDESDNDGYIVTKTNETGTIQTGVTATAAFENYKGSSGGSGGGGDTSDPDGGVKITKTVTGNKAPAQSIGYAFKVWVKSSGGSAVSENVSYKLVKADGTTENGSLTIGKDGYSFSLKNGESMTFSQIDSGRTVEVKEITTGSFTTTAKGLTDGICEISSDTTKTVEFVNDYGNTSSGGDDPDDPTPTDPKPTEPTEPDPKPTEPNPPKPPERPLDKVPQTGVNSNIELWIGLACLSLLGMASVLWSRKRFGTRNSR